MSVDISPPLILAPPFVEHPAAKARRHAPPPPRTTTRTDSYLNRIVASQSLWLTPVLLLQAVLCLRLSNGLSDDEALSLNAGHQMIAHLLHGTPSPAFGQYFSGIPALFAVPAAMLDHVGGPELVRGVNTVLVIAATVFVYLATRRMVSHGAALFGAAAFAINPATLFAARYASVDALCLVTLAGAMFALTKATVRRRYALLAGALLATAVAEKYVVALFIPGALVIGLVVLLRRADRQQATRAMVLAAAATLVGLGCWAAIGHNDWSGFTTTGLGGRTIASVTGGTMLRQAWEYLGPIALASVAAVWLLRGRRRLAAALCVTGLAPVAVEVIWQQSAAIERNAAISMVFLAPLLGALATWLVSSGRRLGLRAPLAVVGGVALLSFGMGTSATMIHAWPTATSIDGALRYYAHDGNQRYLVDGSDLPAYYLSDITSYSQWASTLDQRYATQGGTLRLREDLQSGTYRLVLYRNDGATPSLDSSMLATLRTRYTLVAKVPVIPGKPTAYWSLWLSELP